MNNTKYTPGPWSTYFNSQNDMVIRKMFPDGQESHTIARCHSGAASAFLIAAAPELLSALKTALQALESISSEMTVGEIYTNAGQYLIDALQPARAAISKATGGEA